MILKQLFERILTAVIVGDPELAITGLEYDSRRVKPGAVFFAIRGLSQDGTRFIPEALARGAVAVVSEFSAESVSSAQSAQATWVQTPDVRRALALERVAGCRFYAAVLTNVSHDHLDFHGNVESYFAA